MSDIFLGGAATVWWLATPGKWQRRESGKARFNGDFFRASATCQTNDALSRRCHHQPLEISIAYLLNFHPTRFYAATRLFKDFVRLLPSQVTKNSAIFKDRTERYPSETTVGGFC